MLFLLQQYQDVILTLLQMTKKIFSSPSFKVRVRWVGIDIFYLSGEPISLHLLLRDLFAVYKYSFMGHIFVAAAILPRK